MSKKEALIVTVMVVVAFIGAMVGMALLIAPSIQGSSPTPEQQYVQEVRDVFAHDDLVPDQDLIKVGEQVCVALFLRTDEETIVGVGVLNGIAAEDMTTVIEAAKKHLCDK